MGRKKLLASKARKSLERRRSPRFLSAIKSNSIADSLSDHNSQTSMSSDSSEDNEKKHRVRFSKHTRILFCEAYNSAFDESGISLIDFCSEEKHYEQFSKYPINHVSAYRFFKAVGIRNHNSKSKVETCNQREFIVKWTIETSGEDFKEYLN